MIDLNELSRYRDTRWERMQGVLIVSEEDLRLSGAFRIPVKSSKRPLLVIASNGEIENVGWDHVSVSLPARCPSWEEMCTVKDLFFDPEDTVMQLHPPRSENISNHAYCLHLWRSIATALPVPPSILVGLKELGTMHA